MVSGIQEQLSCQQSVFRNPSKTIDHILRLHGIVQNSSARDRSALAVIMYIEKAYDVVRKEVIILKSIKLDLKGECSISLPSIASGLHTIDD